MTVPHNGGASAPGGAPLPDVYERAAEWWLCLFGTVAFCLIFLAFFMPFKWWALATLIGFGTMEGVGVLGHNPRYPPLTDIIRCYVPRWLALGAIWALAAAAASKWGLTWHHTWWCAVFFGGMGWVTDHFIHRFDETPSD